METATMSSTRRSTLGPRLRQALACVILPGLALATALGCGPGTNAPAPTISGVPAPNVYPNSITVTGTGFSYGITAAYVGGVPVVQSTGSTTGDTQITFQVPAAAVTGPITVVTSGGTATSATDFEVVPTISTAGPSSGAPTTTTVTITGYGLMGVSGVLFGTTQQIPIPQSAFGTANAQEITFTVPSTATVSTPPAPTTYTLQLDWGLSPIINDFTVN